MVRRLALSIFAVLLATTLTLAQRTGQTPRQTTELVVKVTYENDRAVADQVRIQLLNGSGIPVTETFTRGEGEARFFNIEPGTYRIKASGVDIEERSSEQSFVINPRELTHMEFFQVRLKEDRQQTSTQGSISAAMLNIPGKAESEFEKGVGALKKQEFDEAEKRFKRAIELYPRYAQAYINLGFIAMQHGQPDSAQSFFTQAVKADEQYAPSYVNLAKSFIGRKEYPPALELLTKASSLAPNNVEVLALLTMLEYESSQMVAAVDHARKVHALPSHEKFAFAHFIAGKALESQNLAPDAVAEYKLFLKEGAQGPTADKAKASIDALEKQKR